MGAPQYTWCVKPENYVDPGLPDDFWSFVGQSLTSGGILGVLSKICDYIMGNKLVCLGGYECAIGHVTEFETVDDKDGYEKLDNDFSINILLAPNDLELFAQHTMLESYDLAAMDGSPGNGLQGYLIRQQPGTPVPREDPRDPPWPYERYAATFTEYPDKNYITYNPFLGQQGVPYKVPVLHCEIEGERIHAFCTVVSFFNGFGTHMCEAEFLGIPFGKVACWIVGWVFAPMITAALTTAWFAGSDDNRDFDDAGSLTPGDCVAITGRWVYDAGHSGQNELHAVTSVQKIDDPEVCEWGPFQELRDRWCRLTTEVPPPGGPGGAPEGQPTTMTPEQQTVFDNQRKPENRWVFHPFLDGCEPPEEDQPPIIK
jgi:hypothetical protein